MAINSLFVLLDQNSKQNLSVHCMVVKCIFNSKHFTKQEFNQDSLFVVVDVRKPELHKYK